ncbi:DUF4878 domain-containing protein [Salinicola avicenniae]|uniref:DUF4878 domain-containing protein n=1 Tax=Salinicola avicenniae TaxID=2916836 RepID=UPI00207378C0|nr:MULTISPECIES: DUF4878 domain-containing protein [unclassified Salinicola]
MKRFALYPLFLLMTAMTLVACSGGDPESTASAFYEAAAEGDVDGAVELISFAGVGANEMVQAKGKVQMIVGNLESRVAANDGLDTVETLETQVSEDGQTAVVRSRITFGNGKSTSENTRLVKEDGDWKVSFQ